MIFFFNDQKSRLARILTTKGFTKWDTRPYTDCHSPIKEICLFNESLLFGRKLKRETWCVLETFEKTHFRSWGTRANCSVRLQASSLSFFLLSFVIQMS